MKPVWLPVICLTFLLLVPSARVTEAPIATDSWPTGDAPTEEHSPCGINLRASYDTRVVTGPGQAETDWLKLDLWNSSVRTFLGTWASLGPRCNVPKGTRYLHVNDYDDLPDFQSDFQRACELDMGCNIRRRYKFLVCVPTGRTIAESCEVSPQKAWTYYPSADGWAERGEVDIDLGDLGLLFPHLIQEPEDATPNKSKAKK